MTRLTKTYEDGTYGVADDLPCGENSYDFKNLLIQTLGKYEDAEEKGLLFVLPCKMGDTVYIARDDEVIKSEVRSVVFNKYHDTEITYRTNSSAFRLFPRTIRLKNGDAYRFNEWQYNVFHTREEAEEALKTIDFSEGE